MLNLQKHLTKLEFLPVMMRENFSHRIYKGYFYSDEARSAVCEAGASWIINRIFELQNSSFQSGAGELQFWEIKNMPDNSVSVSCLDEKGKVIYYEQGFTAKPPHHDLSLVLHANILHARKVSSYS